MSRIPDSVRRAICYDGAMLFTETIANWQPFYIAVTEASATLAGLLFFSITYNGSVIERPENDHLHRLAEQALSNFVMLMIVGLLFLIPHQTSLSLGIPILVLALFSAYRSAYRLWKQHKHVDNTPYLYWRFITSLVCSLILVGFGEDLLNRLPSSGSRVWSSFSSFPHAATRGSSSWKFRAMSQNRNPMQRLPCAPDRVSATLSSHVFLFPHPPRTTRGGEHRDLP